MPKEIRSKADKRPACFETNCTPLESWRILHEYPSSMLSCLYIEASLCFRRADSNTKTTPQLLPKQSIQFLITFLPSTTSHNISTSTTNQQKWVSPLKSLSSPSKPIAPSKTLPPLPANYGLNSAPSSVRSPEPARSTTAARSRTRTFSFCSPVSPPPTQRSHELFSKEKSTH